MRRISSPLQPSPAPAHDCARAGRFTVQQAVSSSGSDLILEAVQAERRRGSQCRWQLFCARGGPPMAPCDADTSRRPLGIAMGRGDQPCAPAFFPRGLILLVGDLVVVDVVVALLLPLLVLLLLLAFAVSHTHTVSHSHSVSHSRSHSTLSLTTTPCRRLTYSHSQSCTVHYSHSHYSSHSHSVPRSFS